LLNFCHGIFLKILDKNLLFLTVNLLTIVRIQCSSRHYTAIPNHYTQYEELEIAWMF